MDEKKKSKKITQRVILIVVLLLLAGCGTLAVVLSQNESVRESFESALGGIFGGNKDEDKTMAQETDKIREYLADDGSKKSEVTAEEADEWLKKFFSSEKKDLVEVNRTLKIKKGYTVNGTKSISGKGTFLIENSSGGSLFSVSANSTLLVDGITADCNYQMGVGVSMKEKASLSWTGGGIYRAMDYGVYSRGGEVEISSSSIQDTGSWIVLKDNASAIVKDTDFYKAGSNGIEVGENATCHVSGEKTLFEQSNKCAVRNEGVFTMEYGRFNLTASHAIENAGDAQITGVEQKLSKTGGLIKNEAGATAVLKDCNTIGNKYHVENWGRLDIEDCRMNRSMGSAILNEESGEVTVKDVTVKSTMYSAVYNRNGIAHVKNLTGVMTLSSGIANYGTMDIDGISIDRCKIGIDNRLDDDPGVEKITVKNATVKNARNYNIVSYGGICNVAKSTLYPSAGYSMYIRGGSSVLDSIKILGTTTKDKGGIAVGSSTYKTPVVTVKGNTEITGCMSRGIINYNKLTIENCNIHDNNVAGNVDRGAGIETYGELIMKGGVIHDNYSKQYGGGVGILSNESAGLTGKMYMYGGSIYNNESAATGGGIHVTGKGTLEIHGGSVYNNKAQTKGEGILINAGCTFNIYDADSLDNNDIYLVTTAVVNVKSDKLSFDRAVVTTEDYSNKRKVVEFKNAQTAERLIAKFSARNHQFDIVGLAENGVLARQIKDFDTSYDFSGAEKVTVTTFEQLKNAVLSTKAYTSKVITVGSDIVMTGNITLPARTDIKITDDGAVRKLIRGTDKNLFIADSFSHLVLGGNAGIIMDGDALNGRVVQTSMVQARNFGYFVLEDKATMQNAYDTGTTSAGGVRGAAADTGSSGFIIIKGGRIINCSSPDDGKYDSKYCAVYGSSTGGISMKGGTIRDCNDRAILSYSNVYMSAGTIENCRQMKARGGALFTTGFVMTGGIIKNCTSTNSGSAVSIETDTYPPGYFRLDGGTITGNKNGTSLSTNSYGGAVYIDKGGVFDFVSGTLSDNVAGDEDYRMQCAALVNEGTVNIGEGAVISGNMSTLSIGAIFNRATGTMTIKGAEITGNISTNIQWTNGESYGGSAAIRNEGTLVLDGAKVNGNKVGTYGTVYSYTGTMSLRNMTFTGNVSGANEVITDAYGNKRYVNNKGVDLTIGGGTAPVTLSGKIVANETDAAVRLNADRSFALADDFSTESKINLYLDGSIYLGRKVLEGNVTPDKVKCFTWTNKKDGYYLADDGTIKAEKIEAVIGDTEYATLEEAINAAKDTDTVKLLCDVTLSERVTVKKGITITTDGKEDRTITLDEGVAGGHAITVDAAGKDVVFKGASKTSRIIVDGSGVTMKGSFIYVNDKKADTLTLQDVTMKNITGKTYGAAVYCKALLAIKDCTFENCNSVGGSGGAVYASAQQTKPISISGSTFTGNQADISNGGGGALYVASLNTVEIKDCTFENNTSTGGAGGAVGVGTAGSTLNLSGRCIFKGNKAAGTSGYKGGGAVFSPSNFFIKSGAWVEMTGNQCTGYTSGDAIVVNKNSEINFTVESGGALYVYDNPDAKDTDNDICNGDGIAIVPTTQEGGIFSTSAPAETTSKTAAKSLILSPATLPVEMKRTILNED